MDSSVQVALISFGTATFTLIVKAVLDMLTYKRKRKYSSEDIDREAKDKKDEAMYLAMAGLLRSNMIDNHDKYMDKGYITVHGLENWEKMYHPYKGLGGNGMVDSLNEDIRELKVKNDDEESK